MKWYLTRLAPNAFIKQIPVIYFLTDKIRLESPIILFRKDIDRRKWQTLKQSYRCTTRWAHYRKGSSCCWRYRLVQSFGMKYIKTKKRGGFTMCWGHQQNLSHAYYRRCKRINHRHRRMNRICKTRRKMAGYIKTRWQEPPSDVGSCIIFFYAEHLQIMIVKYKIIMSHNSPTNHL